jgi:hypothetical protein
MWFVDETNTLAKISARLAEQGIINKKLDRPYSTFGISISAWRWATQNIEEAKDDFRKSYEARGLPFDAQGEENFYRKMMIAVKNVYYGRSLERWIRENDLEKYRRYI